jgi:hypothetical protein
MNLNNILQLHEEFHRRRIPENRSRERYHHYALVHHSCAIGGSQLTEPETHRLLEEDKSAEGKPMTNHHMVQDLYQALLFVLETSKNQVTVDLPFIQKIEALIMQNTGTIHNTIHGSYDSSR